MISDKPLTTDVCKYIPQRPPIVMIDSFFGIEENRSQSGLTIKSDNILVDGDTLADGGIVEHIAQSGAMHIGYEHISKGEKVPLGFIGAVNKLSISRLPHVGETLRTTIVMEAQVFDVTLVGATVCVGEEVIATCKMKVATQQQ